MATDDQGLSPTIAACHAGMQVHACVPLECGQQQVHCAACAPPIPGVPPFYFCFSVRRTGDEELLLLSLGMQTGTENMAGAVRT